MNKRLSLKKEVLTDLDTGALAHVVGGTQSVALCSGSCSVCSIGWCGDSFTCPETYNCSRACGLLTPIQPG